MRTALAAFPVSRALGLSTVTEAGHLMQLTRMGFSNCYLVREEDGLTLVDTSLRGSARMIISAAERIGSPIRRILITHPHVDHVGSLDALLARLPAAEVMMSDRDARLMRGDFSRPPGELDGRVVRSSFARTKTTPTRRLVAGERVWVARGDRGTRSHARAAGRSWTLATER